MDLARFLGGLSVEQLELLNRDRGLAQQVADYFTELERNSDVSTRPSAGTGARDEAIPPVRRPLEAKYVGSSRKHAANNTANHVALPMSRMHRERNRFNHCPAQEPEGNFLTGYYDRAGREWSGDWFLFSEAPYHGDYPRSDGTWPDYDSYRRPDPAPGFPDSGSQCVYDPDGQLVIHGPFQGTFDYVQPDRGVFRHRRMDVDPHNVNQDYVKNLTRILK